MRDEHNGPLSNVPHCKLAGDVAGAFLNDHARTAQLGDASGIADRPDATERQAPAQFLRPEEMSGLAFLAVAPC